MESLAERALKVRELQNGDLRIAVANPHAVGTELLPFGHLNRRGECPLDRRHDWRKYLATNNHGSDGERGNAYRR